MFRKNMHSLIKTAFPSVVKSLRDNLKSTVRWKAIVNGKNKAFLNKFRLKRLLKTRITILIESQVIQILYPSKEFVQSSIRPVFLLVI